MILKATSKNISGAVGSGIGQQKNRPLIKLTCVVGKFRISQGSAVGQDAAAGHAAQNSFHPFFKNRFGCHNAVLVAFRQ